MIYLINTITSWDEPPRARHQVAQALAKNYKVYFIARNEFGIPKLAWNIINPNLTVIKPYFPVDYRIRYRMPVINEIYQNWLFRKLSHSFKKPRVINFDYTATQIFKYFPRNRIIYYCNDDYIGNSSYRFKAIDYYHSFVENQAIKKSHICVGTSDFLYQKLLKKNVNSYLIPLGAPDDISPKWQVYKNNKKSEKIRVVCLGFLSERKVDIEYVVACLETGKFEIDFIGPYDASFKGKFERYTQVNFLGSKIGDDLYSALSRANVCIAPYNLKRINRGVTPNKMWLYLCLGKPVVITKLPNLKKYIFEKDLIYQADNKKEFVNSVITAFNNDSRENCYKRINYAHKNSWRKRLDCLLKLIE